MRKLLMLVVLFLVSCADNAKENIKEDLSKYKCSEKQLELINKEVAICITTNYFSDVCFYNAKISHCEKINDEFYKETKYIPLAGYYEITSKCKKGISLGGSKYKAEDAPRVLK